MKILLTFIYLISIINCSDANDNLIVDGELYIKTIELGSFYPLNQEESNKKLKELSQSQLLPNGKELIDYYESLKLAKLLDKPSINLILKNGKKMKVFINREEYNKVTEIQLVENSKEYKYLINLELEKRNDNFNYSKKIKSIKRIEGPTTIIK